MAREKVSAPLPFVCVCVCAVGLFIRRGLLN
jgi:hypothetical protein